MYSLDVLEKCDTNCDRGVSIYTLYEIYGRRWSGLWSIKKWVDQLTAISVKSPMLIPYVDTLTKLSADINTKEGAESTTRLENYYYRYCRDRLFQNWWTLKAAAHGAVQRDIWWRSGILTTDERTNGSRPPLPSSSEIVRMTIHIFPTQSKVQKSTYITDAIRYVALYVHKRAYMYETATTIKWYLRSPICDIMLSSPPIFIWSRYSRQQPVMKRCSVQVLRWSLEQK